MKLEKLTPDQDEKREEVKAFWLNYIFSCQNPLNKEQAKIGIDWMYKLANKKEPVVVYVSSPIGCQIAVAYLKEFLKQTNAKNRDSVGDSVRDSVGASVRASVRDSKIEYNNFASYGSISDYGWVSFYDFFTQIGVINHDGFNKFKNIMLSGVYDMIQLEGFCIVSDLPEKIRRNRFGRMHCEDGPAISFRDGYSLYYWNGVNVPEFWIKNKETITKDVILSQDNAEKRRCLREILGAKVYYDIISDGAGVNLIDEDIDNQGFPMRLYETAGMDSLINKKVQFIEVVCPSTERVYNIYPPNQQSKNVFEAKASTFNKTQKEFQPAVES